MAVIRFKLDLSQLNDAAYGLDGPSGRSFILDSSQLDGTDVLDGSPFLTTATASSSLGGLSASASATVTEFAVFSATLGGLSASASATVNEFAILSASLGRLDANATAVVTPGSAPPSPNGGRRNYPPARRKKLQTEEPNYEPVPVATKVRYAICSTVLGSINSQATGSITFSILNDDAEVLLMV